MIAKVIIETIIPKYIAIQIRASFMILASVERPKERANKT